MRLHQPAQQTIGPESLPLLLTQTIPKIQRSYSTESLGHLGASLDYSEVCGLDTELTYKVYLSLAVSLEKLCSETLELSRR